jgi:hypothetical protein
MKTTLFALLLLATAAQADVSYIQELNGPLTSNRGYTVIDDGVYTRYIPTKSGGLYANDRPGYIVPSNDPNTSLEGITQRLHQQHEDFMRWHEDQ